MLSFVVDNMAIYQTNLDIQSMNTRHIYNHINMMSINVMKYHLVRKCVDCNSSGTFILLLSLDVKFMNPSQKNTDYTNTHYKNSAYLNSKFTVSHD